MSGQTANASSSRASAKIADAEISDLSLLPESRQGSEGLLNRRGLRMTASSVVKWRIEWGWMGQ